MLVQSAACGWHRLCSHRRHSPRRSSRPRRAASRADGLLCHHARRRRHHPRLPRHATLAERVGRRGALAFYFALMMVFIALTFGKVYYLGANGLPWFFVCLFSSELAEPISPFTPSGSRAISHRMPSQRLRLLHLLRALRRSRNHVSSRSRRAPLRLDRHARGFNRDSLCHRPPANSIPARRLVAVPCHRDFAEYAPIARAFGWRSGSPLR